MASRHSKQQQQKVNPVLLATSAAVALVVVMVVVVISLVGGGGQGQEEESSGTGVPEGMVLVNDLYEGQRLVPNFDMDLNQYDTEKFVEENGFIRYQDGKAVAGVDVSEHQWDIEWSQVANSGVDFAMIRLGYRGYTEGGLFEDPYYKSNMDNALANGLEVGVYMFSQAISVEEAVEEAEFVIERLEGYDVTMPVVFDWERQNYAGSRTQTIPDTDLLCSMANAFCADIEAAGYEAMIYFYQNLAYNNLDLSQLLDYPFWLAQYTDYPSFYYDFDMWQYTSSGKVPGISGNVDLNLRFFRDGELPPEDSEEELPQDLQNQGEDEEELPQDLRGTMNSDTEEDSGSLR